MPIWIINKCFNGFCHFEYIINYTIIYIQMENLLVLEWIFTLWFNEQIGLQNCGKRIINETISKNKHIKND